MKPLIFPVLAGLIVSAASFYAGRQSVETSPPPPTAAQVATDKPSGLVLPAFLPQAAREASTPVKLEGNPERVASTALGVLGRSDPLAKLAGQVELLRQIKPEHIEPLLAAYRMDQAAGRTTGFESGLLYLRLGQLTGKTHLEPLMPTDEKTELSHPASQVMEGWASVEPEKAHEWFRSWPRWNSRTALAKAMLRGMASHDLAGAEKFVAVADLELRRHLVPAYFSSLANLKGREAAISWAESQLKAPATTVPALVNQEQEFRRTLTLRMVELLGHGPTQELRDFVARLALANELPRKDWQPIMKELGKRDQETTLDWMLKTPLIREREGINNPLFIWGFTETWINVDAAACSRWIDAQTEHPMRDFVVWTYANRLKSQNSEAARQLVSTMRDSKRKMAALEEITKAEVKNTPK